MRNIIFIFVFSLISLSLFAQESSDPQATAILKTMKEKFESFKTIQADFTLTIAFPEEDPESQKGKISLMGEQYKLEMEDQNILCDGNALWLHLKSRNEVQINSYDPDEQEAGMISPKDLFQIYETEDFIYALTNETTEKGITIQQIEFKPMDPNSEYSKLRLTINKKSKDIIRIKTFSKDGSRFTLAIDRFTADLAFNDAYFKFDASQYPNILVEDLRN